MLLYCAGLRRNKRHSWYWGLCGYSFPLLLVSAIESTKEKVSTETLSTVRHPCSFVFMLLKVCPGCWITDRFRAEQIVLDYLWYVITEYHLTRSCSLSYRIWIASFLNCIIYGILALVVNGFIGGGKLRISSSSTGGVIGRRDSARRGGRTVATQMLLYVLVSFIGPA